MIRQNLEKLISISFICHGVFDPKTMGVDLKKNEVYIMQTEFYDEGVRQYSCWLDRPKKVSDDSKILKQICDNKKTIRLPFKESFSNWDFDEGSHLRLNLKKESESRYKIISLEYNNTNTKIES